MLKTSPKTQPTLETITALLDEVDEYYERVRKIWQKLGRLHRGSEAYLDLLPDLETELFTLKLKVERAYEALEEFTESLPDEYRRQR